MPQATNHCPPRKLTVILQFRSSLNARRPSETEYPRGKSGKFSPTTLVVSSAGIFLIIEQLPVNRALSTAVWLLRAVRKRKEKAVTNIFCSNTHDGDSIILHLASARDDVSNPAVLTTHRA